MTEQPGGIPPIQDQGTQGTAEAGDEPVTPEELRAAIEHVLRYKGMAVVRWANSTVKKLDALLADAVPAPERRTVWVAMLTLFLQQRSGALATALKPHFAEAAETGFERMSEVPHGLLRCHVSPKPDKATFSQIEGFVYDSGFCIGAEEALAAMKSEYAEYTQRPAVLEPLLTMFLGALVDHHRLLDAMVREARTTLHDIGAMQLEPFLAPLTVRLTALCQSADAVLAANAPQDVRAQADARLIETFASSVDDQKAVIGGLVPSASSACQALRFKLSPALRGLHPELLQRLAPLAGLKGADRSACLTLLGVYQVPWILCMGSLTASELTLLTTRCAHKVVRDALTKRVQAANIGDLSKVVQVIIDPHDDWEVACGKVHTFGYAGIPLPDGVTALAWRPVGGCWVPGAFACGAMETDLACLKHMAEELGATPSVAKAAAYFADLVTVCVQACTQWAAAGKPQVHAATIVLHDATWNIRVRDASGNPQVFHVDSGYEKSAWVKRAV